MFAHDHVSWLYVTVKHPARVGVINRVADVDEATQQLAQLQRAASGVRLER